MSSVMRHDGQRNAIERCWMLARLNAENRAAVLRRVTREVFPRLRGRWWSHRAPHARRLNET